MVAIDKVKDRLIADYVSNAILEKLGNDAPKSLKAAAVAAGKCFAQTATTKDLAVMAMRSI